MAAAAGIGLAAAFAWRVGSTRRSAAGASLSVFEPHAGGCAWFRWDIERREDQPVAHFPNDCVNVHAAWNDAGTRAVVWFAPQGFASQEDMLFLVEVQTRKFRRLPLPEVGEAQSYLFDTDGRVLAFTEDQNVALVATGEEGSEGTVLEWRNQRWPLAAVPEDGQAVLAHALQYDEQAGAWQIVETTPSRCCVEGAPGVRVLGRYTQVHDDPRLSGRQSARLLRAMPPSSPVDARPLLAEAKGALPPGIAEGQPGWRLLEGSAWPRALLYRTGGGELARPTAAAFFAERGQARPLPGLRFSPGDQVQLMTLGPYLLITDWGTGNDPHLYDARTGELVYSAPVAVETTFWPAATPP